MGFPKKERYEMVEKLTALGILNNGLQLTEDFTLNIDELEAYRDDLRWFGGVYRYYSISEGELFIGSTDDLWKTLKMTISRYGNGNKKLQAAVYGKEDVYLYIYLEPNAAIRCIYEGYMHILYSPVLNNKNVGSYLPPKSKEDE